MPVMRRSKNQAVFSYLPGMWISDNSENPTITARIDSWNWREMKGIYPKFIDSEIKRQINLFADRGGDISSYTMTPDKQTFLVTEVAQTENVSDIFGTMSPLVFYCSYCGAAFSLRDVSDVGRDTWTCKYCHRQSVKQLQMVCACECGHAEPVRLPNISCEKPMRYYANDAKFKFFYRAKAGQKTQSEYSIKQLCPNCNSSMQVDNATSNRNYRPFALHIINLVDQRSGEFYDKGLPAQKTVLARWFDKCTPENFEYLLDHIGYAFSEDNTAGAEQSKDIEKFKMFLTMGIITQDQFDQMVAKAKSQGASEHSVERYVAACDDLLGNMKLSPGMTYTSWVNYASFRLMQYYTLKDCKKLITLQDAIDHELQIEFIDSADEIYDLNAQLGIANMQVARDVEIINCVYGYTRRVADPKKSNNHNVRLKMNAFGKNREGTQNLVYGSKLNTEGILFEISQRKIIEWLAQNKIIAETAMPDLNDPLSVKKWYAENVHGDQITPFGADTADDITKNVFALLHSMSHAFINTAGQLSGLSGNSLTENIIVETASIFIYAQSGQGITLGSLSGMVESNYIGFLRKAFADTRSCAFDPICTERDDTACSACLIIPEISCSSFNAELGRKYLYTIEGVETPKTGFWEMK